MACEGFLCVKAVTAKHIVGHIADKLHLTNGHAKPFDRTMDVTSQTVLHDHK